MANQKKTRSNATYNTQTGIMVFVPIIIYVVSGAYVYRLIEGFSLVDSYYFVVISLATIGYGDVVPHTSAGKIFTMFYIVGGLALFSGLITTIVARAKSRREKRLENRG